MTFHEFKESTNQLFPPESISQNLLALWQEAKGNWNEAHDIVQNSKGHEGDWIHAYLHRKEGDLHNASYWYSRTGKSIPDISLKQEWEELARFMIANNQ